MRFSEHGFPFVDLPPADQRWADRISAARQQQPDDLRVDNAYAQSARANQYGAYGEVGYHRIFPRAIVVTAMKTVLERRPRWRYIDFFRHLLRIDVKAAIGEYDPRYGLPHMIIKEGTVLRNLDRFELVCSPDMTRWFYLGGMSVADIEAGSWPGKDGRPGLWIPGNRLEMMA
jgi:hypothetical protein